MDKVRKAIFPIAGLATRFLPESKVVSKEMIPLAGRPFIDYTVKEAMASGIENITFITRPKQKGVFEYFERDEKLEKILEENKRDREVKILKELSDVNKNITFKSVLQKKPTGDASAIFLARELIGEEPCAICFSDDIVDSKVPCLKQLEDIFMTCKRPVLALKKMPEDRLPNYGVAKVEKIANRFYKIQGIKQKPKPGEEPSNLAVLGRMIITPDVFDYLKNSEEIKKKDGAIVPSLGEMAELGKAVYGYEIEGEWLECGDIPSWYKSFVKMALADPEYGDKLRAFLKTLKI